MPRNCLSYFLLPALCLLGWKTVHSQYYFNKLTEENGLSDNRVTSLLKDKTGFLWIGTRSGLNRFDGNTFTVFKPGSGNSISSEEINDIVQDSSGKIWVATMNGLNIYDPANNRWETLLPTGSNVEGDIPSYLIWDLYVDRNNRVWIVSDVWELSAYDPVSKKFTYLDWPAAKQQPQFANYAHYRSIQKITPKNARELWLATTIGLFSVDTQTGEFSFYGGGYANSIKDLRYDEENKRVYLVTENARIFCYDENDRQYRELGAVTQSYPAAYWKKATDLREVMQLAHPAGMLEVNRTTSAATIILHQPTLSSTLLPGGTNIIYSSSDGITWAGTNNGISFFNSHHQSAEFIPLSVVSDKESIDGMSAALYDEIEGKYYITSVSTNEVFVIDRQSGRIYSIKTIDGQPLSPCTNICMDRRKNIWLLTESHVYRYERGSGKFRLFPTPNAGKPVNFQDMVEDREGNYWLATWREGLYKYNSKEKSFRRFTSQDSISAINITTLLNDPVDSSVWIGSFNTGLYNYHPERSGMTNYSETPDNPEYMQLNLVRDMEADASGKIWIATYGAGLYYYTPGKTYETALTHITAKDGLTNSSYYSIAADHQNRLWLLSGKELSVIDSTGRFLYKAPQHPAMSFANYVTDVRYPKRIFYNRTHRELLIPVAGGMLIFHPDKPLPPAPFPVVFTDISVGSKSIMYDSAYKRGDHAIAYKNNSLSFHFAALHYTPGQQIHYEYKLHENEKKWKPAGFSNTINLPDLPPGHYTVMVRAKDQYGHVSSNTLWFSFRIIPPFWKQWWFIALVAALICYALYAWTVYLRRKIKTQKILNYFATSLYGQNTVEDIFWDVAKNCISKLKFEDCVVYLYDPRRKVLVQKAAYGPKNPGKHDIINPIEIPIGQGIVGTVALTGKPEIIRDTSKDSRYIVDDERRYSEIAVPIFVDGKVFGVIDSEHRRKNFYRKHHLRILQDIAAVCSNKISKYIIEEKLRSKISRDLHDEIGSALTSINLLSKVALNKAADDTEISSYLTRINDSTFRTMESMSDIVWAINPRNDKLEALTSRMKEFAADICEAKDIDVAFKLPEELEILSIDLAKRKNLFLIFKEAVNNAVKYSGCTLLRIEFDRTDHLLQMVITDNGKGFDQSTISQGNGLYNMQERATECEGTLQVQSVAGQGTRVALQIPITFFGVSVEI